MAQQVVRSFGILVRHSKSLESLRKTTSLHEVENKSNVDGIQKTSLVNKKHRRIRHSHPTRRTIKIIRHHHSLAQVDPTNKVFTQSIPIRPRNRSIVENAEQRSTSEIDATDILPSTHTNSSHLSQDEKNVNNNGQLSESLILPIKTLSNRSKSKDEFLKPKNQMQERRKIKCYNYFSCSPCCAILSVLGAIVLLAGFSALIMSLSGSHQTTSESKMKTTSTLSIPSTMTTTTISTSTLSSTTTTTTTTTKTTSTILTSTTTTETTSLPTTTSITTSITTSTETKSTTTWTTSTTTCSPIFASNSSLVVYFPMDSSPSYLIDSSGTITATAVSVTSVIGHRNEGLSFLGTINSYFQINGLISLGTPNGPFSISVYIKPNVLSGTIVHISKFITGTSGWCLPFIGFSSTNNLAIQVWGGSTANYVLGPIPPLNSWTHVVQTWSSANGLTLYIDGVFYAQNSLVLTYAASGVANYLTLGSTRDAIPYPANGCSTTGLLGGLGYYNGSIDELRIYSRELTYLEVCVLAKY